MPGQPARGSLVSPVCIAPLLRPRDIAVAGEFARQFPSIPLFGIDRFGGWQTAQKAHFADGGVFDQIYKK
mgnify:CR=1 FL=1